MNARVAALALAATALSTATAARAEEPRTSSLSWLRMPGAEGCVTTQALARAVEERLGRSAFVSAAQADLSVEGSVAPRPRGYRAQITVRDAKGDTLGTREIERDAATCAELTDSIALVVALMIDPDAATKPKPAPAPPPPAPPPPPVVIVREKPVIVERPAPPEKKREPWRFDGGAGLTAATGLAPTVAPGIMATALIYPPGLPVGFHGFASLFLPTEARGVGATATVDMGYLGGSLCPTLRGKRASLMACVGGHLGLLRPRAQVGSSPISESVLPLWNLLGELRLSVPLVHPIGVFLGIGGVLPLLRPSFEYRRPDATVSELHRVSVVAATADAGIGIILP